MGIVQEIGVKSKALLGQKSAEWGLFLLISLAMLLSFGLGRLSALVDARPLIELQTAAAGEGGPLVPLGGLYVASRSGSTYYFPWCAGAARIKVENERWFKTEEDARQAGYRPAKNCKGLGE